MKGSILSWTKGVTLESWNPGSSCPRVSFIVSTLLLFVKMRLYCLSNQERFIQNRDFHLKKKHMCNGQTLDICCPTDGQMLVRF